MENEELIFRAQKGDRAAVSKLLLQNRSIVQSVTFRLIENSEARKDVIQNVFLKVIRSIDSFQNKCRFTTWLYRIALNECIQFNRSLSSNYQSGVADGNENRVDPDAPDGYSEFSRHELRIEIGTAVNKLPLDQKTAFILFYSGGYSGREASNVMQITEANFFMKLKAARDTVRKHLEKRGFSNGI